MPESMLFIIDPKDVEKLQEFLKSHEGECKMRNVRQGAIAVAGSYVFTNTSIGQMRTYRCVCGEEFLMNDDF